MLSCPLEGPFFSSSAVILNSVQAQRFLQRLSDELRALDADKQIGFVLSRKIQHFLRIHASGSHHLNTERFGQSRNIQRHGSAKISAISRTTN